VFGLIPPVIISGILLYEIIQVTVAFIAVVLALRWGKPQFLAGLIFLLIYAVLEMVDIFLFSIAQGIYLDVAQFGFILLAIIFFIFGMSPYWKPAGVSGTKQKEPGNISSGAPPILSILKKI
jgi:hypothetical protein